MIVRTCALLLCGCFTCLIILRTATTARAQGPVVRGEVVDALTSRPVSGVHVTVLETDRLVVTDTAGVFRLEHLDPGQYTVSFRHVGFAAQEFRLYQSSEEETQLRISLRPVVFQTPEMVIRSTRTSTTEVQAPYPVHVVPASQGFAPSHVTAADALDQVPGLALVRDGVWATALSIRA